MGIKKKNNKKESSLSALMAGAVEKVNFHIVIFASLLFIVLNTSIFTTNVLSHIPSAVSGEQETLYGLMIKTAIFAVCVILLFVLL